MSVQEFSCPTLEQGGCFPGQKAVYDVQLVESGFFCCFRLLQVFFLSPFKSQMICLHVKLKGGQFCSITVYRFPIPHSLGTDSRLPYPWGQIPDSLTLGDRFPTPLPLGTDSRLPYPWGQIPDSLNPRGQIPDSLSLGDRFPTPLPLGTDSRLPYPWGQIPDSLTLGDRFPTPLP